MFVGPRSQIKVHCAEDELASCPTFDNVYIRVRLLHFKRLKRAKFFFTREAPKPTQFLWTYCQQQKLIFVSLQSTTFQRPHLVQADRRE